jgi:predicted transcriptional regulator YdeE
MLKKLLNGGTKPVNTQDNLDKIASLWNKTKDPKYKELWYRKIKEITHGVGYNNIKRRTLSSNSSGRKRD